ncbi:hypothetical protein [Arthrobacter silvisoli]|uniref:hypothetical protein n=1 Tax=Arthrobacter silvisoli TaxID=2291022 RepID=UPI001FE50FC0|nr:hypothetical protein [Arthrobacter silvisoli]
MKTVAARTSPAAWAAADPLRAVLAILAVITALTGVAEIPFGGFILRLLGAEPTPLALQLFGTVGMFMIVVGGLLLHTLLKRDAAPEVIFWAGLQKAGAFAAVGIGVLNGVFAATALAVAIFDLATAVLCFVYWRGVYWKGVVRP